jgi:hypothetical protein
MFKEWLFSKKPILRNGFAYRFFPPHHSSNVRDVFHEYSVIFSEPLAQGYALPSTTEISVSLCHDAQLHQHIPEKSEADREGEHIEIDQNFMANSVFPKIGCVQHSTSFLSTYTFACLDPNPVPRECKFALVDSARIRLTLPNNYTALLKPSDLNTIGLISGDWVRVTNGGGTIDLLFLRP